MRLLASAIPRFRWLVRTNGWFTFWVFLLVGTVEVVGRKGGSDLHDALAAGLLTCAGFVIAVRHRHAPLPWLAWLLARGRSLLAVADGLFKLELGLDLRGRPP